MGRSTTMELCWGLDISPTLTMEQPNIHIKCLCQKGTCRNCSVGPIGVLVLPMALVKNASQDSVHFLKAGKFDVLNECIKKEIEVFIASLTSIDKVVGSHAVKVIDLRPQGEKDFC